jgi:glutamate/aspartate transport system substrate-binding protein
MNVRLAALAFVALSAGGLLAAEPASVVKRISDTGVVRIGYRDSAMPFSVEVPGGKPYGYSIDLCHAIVDEIGKAVGKPVRVEYRRVTPQDRLDQVASGRIDLECGSTSITDERGSRVAFSPVIFVAATRLLVKRGDALHSMRDLSGRTVVAVRGTTNARAMVGIGAGRVKDLRVTSANSYEEALTMLDTGAADALAADDVLIAGLLASRGLNVSHIMVGEPLSPETYGIAFARGDPGLADVVQADFTRLATTGQLNGIYEKWFLKPLPTGPALGLPLSNALERSFQSLGLPRS